MQLTLGALSVHVSVSRFSVSEIMVSGFQARSLGFFVVDFLLCAGA